MKKIIVLILFLIMIILTGCRDMKREETETEKDMRKSRIVFILLLAALVFAGCGSAEEEVQQINEVIIEEQDALWTGDVEGTAVSSEEEKPGEDFYDSRIGEVGEVESFYEKIYGRKNPDELQTTIDLEYLVVDERFPGAEEINRSLREEQEAIISYARQQAEDAEEMIQDFVDAGFNIFYSYSSFVSEIYYFDGHYLSFYQDDDDSCQGGAHGILYRKGYTFDLQTGQRLALGDVIGDSEEKLKDIVVKYFEEYINKNPDFFWEYAIDVVKENTDLDSSFYLTDSGICFYFPPYALAAFAFGFQEVIIPYEEFELKLPLESVE